jgi:hypothetical protein
MGIQVYFQYILIGINDNFEIKNIKGILKFNPEKQPSEPRSVDPHLILLLKQIQLNPQLYTKDQTEIVLRPYR